MVLIVAIVFNRIHVDELLTTLIRSDCFITEVAQVVRSLGMLCSALFQQLAFRIAHGNSIL